MAAKQSPSARRRGGADSEQGWAEEPISDTLLATITTAPYSFNWTNVPAGTYSVTARANGTIIKAPTTINVANIALSTLATTFTAPASIPLTATTTGPVTQVEFFNGATFLATDSTAPYSFNWTNLPTGTYSVTAKANGIITTAPTNITVTAPFTGSALAGRWPLDSVAANQTADTSGNNNNGLVTGPFTLVPGTIGQALQLDPNSGGILTQRSVIDPTKSFTVAL